MALTIGNRIRSYEVVAAIGAGGMGEVFRACDTKLGRDVAIKVLPPSVTNEPERVARFEREAQVLAALNHPNIAALYHVEETADGPALIMELVEGETLADRIARGPIPLDEALPIARQIAEALEAAHEHGIIHRDLKPANIKVRPDGTVKVLDFGLAKLTESTPVTTNPATLSVSPTITSPALVSGVGVLLGTAAYMSPEQAKGKPADKRSDVWACGCVLYEMLTGTRAFNGDDVADTLAAVLHGEPDWKRLPTTTPPGVQRVLRRCLAKDRRRRLSAIEVVRLEIEERGDDDFAPSPPPTRPAYRQRLAWISVAMIGGLAAIALWIARPPQQPPPSVTFQIAAPTGTTFANGPLSVSPDAKYVAFVATGTDSTSRIWIRAMASLDARALPGTENAGIRAAAGGNSRVEQMTWSPDSRVLAFEQQGRIRKIDIASGAIQTLCDACGEPASWGSDGTILSWGTGTNGTILRLAASGGSATPVAVPNRSSGGAFQYQFPSFLPDGKHFVFLRASNDAAPEMFIGSVENAADRQEAVRLRTVPGQTPIIYVGGQSRENGHLFFMQGDVLVAQPFDARGLTMIGEPVHLLDNVGRAGGGTTFLGASLNGMLAFRRGSADRVLVWYASDGKRLRSLDSIQPYTRAEIQLSPNGNRVITTGPFPTLASWIVDITSDVKVRISPDGVNAHAIWSSDGERIAFSSPSHGKWTLSVKPSNGSATGTLITETAGEVVPNDWSADGRYVLYSAYDLKTRWDLWVISVAGHQSPTPIARSASTEVRGQFSPNGQWIAYESDESGERQIVVKPFVTNGSTDDRRWTIDTGAQVRWSPDGTRLFYRRNDAIVSVGVTPDGLRTGAAKTLFSVNGPGAGDGQNAYYDVSPDGQRFLVTSFPEGNLLAPITVLLNWRTLMAQ